MQHFYLLLLLAWHQFLMTPTLAQTDFFSSTSHISKVLTMKTNFADVLLGYAKNETARLDRLRDFAKALGHLQNSTSAVSEAEHPVSAYVFLRKMGHDWKRFLTSQKDVQKVLKSAGFEVPTDTDADGAADALLRLQSVYSIPAESIARGQFTLPSSETPGQPSPMVLSADHCLHLATQAFKSGRDLIGLEWIRLMLSGAFAHENRDALLSSALDLFQHKLTWSAQPYEYGLVLSDLWQTHRHLFSDESMAELGRNLTAKLHQAEAAKENLANYQALCKDGTIPNKDLSASRLSCWYSVPHPYYTLAPVKKELLNADPFIVFFHDILTDRESDRLMEIADPLMRRSMVVGAGVTKIRISKIAFFPEDADWSVQQVDRKMGFVTGLNELDADQLQIGNYGIGGQYEPHMDSFNNDITKANNRIATVLIYLNNVKQGGGTVFPKLGLRVLPEKNGAVFWYNLRRNSNDIWKTVHAACPVLEGTKWVANKWIYYLGQLHHRPCTLDSNE